jgi:AraC-like DNA-binding protein
LRTQVLLPPPAIAEHVSSILIIEDSNENHDFAIPLFANGNPTLVFQTAHAENGNRQVGNLTLYGQTIKPGELFIRDSFTFIAYFFYPHAIRKIFGIHPKEIKDGYLDLTLLNAVREFSLKERLLHTKSLNESLAIIEKYILNVVNEDVAVDERITIATSQIKNANGIYSLTRLQDDLSITERTFQRMFENNVGISPQLYKRICQFQFAFQKINQHQFVQLTDVAYESGFADQSHFIRVFKEFTGLTPNEYLAKLRPYRPEF